MGNAEYPFINITPKSTLTCSGNICCVPSMGQMDLLRNYLYSIPPRLTGAVEYVDWV